MLPISPLDLPLSVSVDRTAIIDARRGAVSVNFALDIQRHSLSAFKPEIDLGEPETPKVTIALLLTILFFTLVEFTRFGTSPTPQELDLAGGLSAHALARGDLWVVVTSNLLHANIGHFVMNAFIIVLVGRWVEHVIGRWCMLAVVLVSIMSSSFGALLVEPNAVTIGASGIAFALLGCGLVVDPKAKTEFGSVTRGLVVLNVIATFAVPGIAIGGHVGGFLAGVVVGKASWKKATKTNLQGKAALGSVRPYVGKVIALASIIMLTVWCFIGWFNTDLAQSIGSRFL